MENLFIHLTPKYMGTKYFIYPYKEDLVIFRHSHIAITNYTMKDNPAFEKSLSVFDKIAYKYRFVGGYYVKSLRELRINRGYNVYRLREFFPNRKFIVDNDAYPYDPIKVKLFTPPRSDFQRVALTFMAGQGEFERNKQFSQIMIDADTGDGKAQPDNTLIPTKYGWRRLDQLVPGDEIFAEDGTLTTIMEIYPQDGLQETYEITFSDGRKTSCNLEHLWTLYDITQNTVVTIPLSTIKENPKNYLLPLNHPVQYPKEMITDSPGYIGYQLKRELITEIPENYLYNEIHIREKLFHAIFTQKTKNTYSYETGSLILCEQLVELARSLGYYTIKRKKFIETTYDYQIHTIPYYEITVYENRTSMPILSIQKTEPTTQRCILVDNPTHLYQTSDFIVTHNTYCGTASSAFLSAKTVVIVPLTKLLNQWTESFTNFTSIKEEEILIVQGSKVCQEILDGKHRDKKVFIMMVNTLVSFQKTYGDIETMNLLCATRAYTKIVDEVHLDLKAISMIEALSNFRMNYYMSASPGRTDSKENWIFKTLYYHIPRFGSGFKQDDEKHLNIMIKRYYFSPTLNQTQRMVNRKVGLNSKAYEKELIHSQPEQQRSFIESLRLMTSWALRQLKDGNKIMILGQSIEFLEYIHKIIKDLDPDIHEYYGGMKKNVKETALQSKVIIATTASLGTGADIKGLQFVINCSTYSSWVMVTQVSGRLRKLPDGTPTVYIELVNFGYKKTITQYNNRLPHLMKRNRSKELVVIK